MGQGRTIVLRGRGDRPDRLIAWVPKPRKARHVRHMESDILGIPLGRLGIRRVPRRPESVLITPTYDEIAAEKRGDDR
jgi:hypothetical protein